MINLGIFGGTFDPIHEGHLALARAAREQFNLSKVLFIPAFVPPHKSGRHDITPAPYRCRMVELATQEDPFFEVSQVELNRPDVSYTIDTLRELSDLYPEAKLYLILGADSSAQILDWKESDEILKRAHLLVAPRLNSNNLGSSDPHVSHIEMPIIPISSSEIRELIRQAKPIPENVLAPEVKKYIQEMHLYASGAA